MEMAHDKNRRTTCPKLRGPGEAKQFLQVEPAVRLFGRNRSESSRCHRAPNEEPLMEYKRKRGRL
jgi:hypothetical protein